MGSDSKKISTGVAPPARMGVKAGVKDRTRAAPKELQAFHELLESMFEASEAQAAEIGRQRRGISNRRDNSGFGMDKHLAPRDSYLSDVFDGGRRPDRRDPTAQREDYDNRSQTTTIAKPIGNMKNVSDRDMDDYMQKRESIASFRTDLDVMEWLNRTYYMPATSPAHTNNDKGSDASISSAFTPSYPLVLAYAISVLHLSFRNPHAALAVFETARSHSLESYLVGCTTSVYNQMLRARWEGLGDLKGTEEGLEEMERRGVGWDKETMEFANTLMGNLIKPSLRRLSIGLGNGPVSKETTAFIDQRLVWAYGPDVLERRARLEQMIENQVEFSERGVRIQMKRRVDELRERKGRDGSRYGDYTPGDDRWGEYREPEPRWV
ncbi:hypothetical protein NCC49_003835 [Naganishia albida]|nr:hypothetical protein NCC49_003835 [Naganishia albida]